VAKGIKGAESKDDQRVMNLCAQISSKDGGLLRPGLMYESTAKKGKRRPNRIVNMTEIPWTERTIRRWERFLGQSVQ
jgi:hypothetical protein